MNEQTLVHTEGICFANVQMKQVNTAPVAIVPISIENHGLVRAMFWGDQCDCLQNELNNGSAKGETFFLSGVLSIHPSKHPTQPDSKTFMIHSFSK